MKNLNYKWVLLIGAVLGLIVGTFNKDEWETIPIAKDTFVLIYRVNHTTGETLLARGPGGSRRWVKYIEPIHGFKVWFKRAWFGSDYTAVERTTGF